jgi:NAD+ diphosphatase
MRNARPNVFSGHYLDRRAELREDPDWVRAARADSETLYVVSAGSMQLVRAAAAPDILFLPADHALIATAADTTLTLLGWFRGQRCVLVEAEAAALRPERTALPEHARLEELRPLATELPADSAGLLAYVRALTLWRARHRFCGACGAPSKATRAGHVMTCSNEACKSESFPRLDPAIIVLVTDASGELALLGRQASWPPGRYSTIAGFVEQGESLEDAVQREVFEETGVQVGAVDYHSSQPWPFPSSLMLGFQAVASSHEVRHIDGELEDAAWFSRQDIAAGHPMLPPPTSISHRLIEAWFDAGADLPLAEQPNVGRWEIARAR